MREIRFVIPSELTRAQQITHLQLDDKVCREVERNASAEVELMTMSMNDSILYIRGTSPLASEG
jgi:hypothetical protein